MELHHLTFPSHLCLHSADPTEQRRDRRLPVQFSLDPVCPSRICPRLSVLLMKLPIKAVAHTVLQKVYSYREQFSSLFYQHHRVFIIHLYMYLIVVQSYQSSAPPAPCNAMVYSLWKDELVFFWLILFFYLTLQSSVVNLTKISTNLT